MAATYKQFLAAPSSSLLADKASLNYVTTTMSFAGATDIIKHLNTLQKQVKKKKEDILNLVDGQSMIAVEVDTALEFQTSGGVYLPGLDDNFVSDRIAYLPITHMVTFDADGKISQIRQYWDQAALLKQLEVIGKSGRNWPIKDGREQLTLIQSCLKSTGQVPVPVQNQNRNDAGIRTRGNSTNAMRDPRASLQLFGSREEIESAEPAPVISPYAGQRPKQRSFTDILGDDPHHGDPDAQRCMSPSKAGQGKNPQPIRIFEGQEHDEDEDEEDSPQSKPSQYIRPHPTKYQHFDLCDGSDARDASKPNGPIAQKSKTKHDTQWSFEDFTTPVRPKPSRTMRQNPDDRHWDTENGTAEATDAHVGKSRRDVENHFEMQDDGELPPGQQRIATRQKGIAHNEGLGLYKDNVFNRGEESDPSNHALGNITNLKDRGKDFDPHFTMSDESPAAPPQESQHHVPETRMKAVKMMAANWTLADESPVSQKENRVQTIKPQPDTRIHIAGDAMGGKKGTSRNFLYGGDEAAAPHKQLISRKANHGTQKSSFWDF